jgi:hypothetical protein
MGHDRGVPTLDEIGDEIYQLPPAQFVAARNAQAAALKKAGDKELAAQVTALRRPTTLGWLVNLVALRNPDLVASWFAFGEELRQAQTGLVGGEVRRLAADRRALQTELLRAAAALAVEAGHTGPIPVNEISATFNTALADPEVAAQVRAGRLLGGASYAGFGQLPEETWGEAPTADERPATAGARSATTEPETETTETESGTEASVAPEPEPDAEVEAARVALADAQDELARARAEEIDAKRELDELTEQLTDLEARVRDAQRRRGEATTTRQNLERAVTAAREALRRVRR